MNEIIFNRQLLYGKGSLDKIGEVSKNFGKKALIVTGKNSAKKSKALDTVLNILKIEDIKTVIYDKAIPNPTVEIVDNGAFVAKEEKVDFIIGIGGGSAIDTAKAIAAMVKNEGSVRDYLEIPSGKKIKNPAIDVIAIPTTPGTGAEVTKNAVINSTQDKLKVSIRDDSLVPKVAILDPKLIITADDEIIKYSVMDALTQLIEPFVGKKSHPVIDMFIIQGIKLIKENIFQFLENKTNLEKVLNLQLAAYYSGIALANAGLGAVHALSRPFGGIYNLPHGLICAILLPYITKYNWKFNIEKYSQIAIALGEKESQNKEKLAEKVSEIIFEMNKKLKIPENFKNFNIPKKDIPQIIEASKGSSLENNPKQFSYEELEMILNSLI
jgi:alcohol dehydrogenase class IV